VRTELPIAAHDDLAVARLASVKVARELGSVPVGKFLRRRVVVFLPVERGFCHANAVKQAGWHGASGPHLATHSVDRETKLQ
jgi:hypothetical protein